MAGLSLSRVFVLRGDDGAQALYAFLRGNWRQLADAGKPLAITVSEHRAKRSVDQNKRYWHILNEIADNAWLNGKRYSAEAWAEHFKRQFIGTEELPNGGSIGISTTALSVDEFAAYMTRIEVYATETLGVELSQA